MASAMIAGLVRSGHSAASILVVEPAADRCRHLEEALGVRTAEHADDQLAAADLVIWAVKPQVLRQALEQARGHLGAALHISIAAGLPLAVLAHWLQTERVVRAMPNMAALVGAGVTGMVAAPGVSDADKSRAEQALATTGYCFWVENDERLDAVTAISGSGPGYVFHFLEAFELAAEAVGFAPEVARDLVLRTVVGAVEQAKLGESFGTLRSRVTSARGTTAAALAILDERATPQALRDAIGAAYARAGELSKDLSGQSG